MSVTLHQIQEFYCGALKDAIHSEESIQLLMYSLFGVMSTPAKTEEDPRLYWRGSDPQTMGLIDKALLCLGMMIEVLPAKFNVIPYSVEFVNEAISSWSPHTRKAACLAMSVIADSEQADKECLQKLLPLVTMGITDRHPAVRNAALCAVGQFNLNRQIDLQHYCDELLVPLLHCLRLSCEPLKIKSTLSPPNLPPYIGALFDSILFLCTEKDNPIEKRTFGAFRSKVIEYLLLIVNSSCDINFRERAINAVNEIEIFEILQKNSTLEDFQPLAKGCFQFIKAGMKFFSASCTLELAKKILARLEVFLGEDMNKSVVLQVVYEEKTDLEQNASDENLPGSYGFARGLHKKILENSISFNEEPLSTPSPPLPVQEGQPIASNASEISKCDEIKTENLVSSDVDKISCMDIAEDELSLECESECTDRNSTTNGNVLLLADDSGVPFRNLEAMGSEPVEKLRKSVAPVDSSKPIPVQPDLVGKDFKMNGEALNELTLLASKPVSPQSHKDVIHGLPIQIINSVKVQQLNGSEKSASSETVVHVGSDVRGTRDARETESETKISSENVFSPDTEDYQRRSMSLSSLSSVCIIEDDQSVPKCYALSKRSSGRRSSSLSSGGSSRSFSRSRRSFSRSRRKGCKASVRGRERRSRSGSSSPLSSRRRRRRSVSRSRSRSRSRMRFKHGYSRHRRRCWSPTYDRDRRQICERHVDDGKVVYVDLISVETTRSDLHRRFSPFGPIVCISLHFEETSNNYGFIVFAYVEGARLAVLHGNDNPSLPYYNLSLGRANRPIICRSRFQHRDFDATVCHDTINRSPVRGSSFDILLSEAKQASYRKRKMFHMQANFAG